MNTIFIEKLLDDIYDHIKNNIRTITGNDLYSLKERFYKKCEVYKGDTKDLTGFTEVLVSMFLKAFKEELHIPLELENGVSKVGINQRKNQIDYAFLSPDRKIKYGISVKRACDSAILKDHEKNTKVINRFQKPIVLVQDLFRLDNIKNGDNGSFKSVTIIFKNIKDKDRPVMADILSEYEEYQHDYIILEGNHESLFNLLKKKLAI
ncbi:hypothetical protein QT711_07840 [Sporosarcina saromensis]|uniref:Restriction endonuclease n=1 Tax=Sporosarcina saromensis TaxID=359365 RepID=A0ABU4G7Z1_9BACL|nr:hypothetical protein [Sporosarcina saromensis]MDW0113094.1 hypothetical protein [Sporosarcina saromensis]